MLFNEIEKIIAASGEEVIAAGPTDEAAISKVENLLGVKMPLSYRHFLKRYGALSFCGGTYYGITKQGAAANAAPCVLYVTRKARELGDIDDKMIKIKSSGYGPSYSIDTGLVDKNGEAAIVETGLSFKRDGIKKIVAASYSDFIFSCIQEAVDDI